MPKNKNERVELEMKIAKYRLIARNVSDDLSRERIAELVIDLEQKRREIDK